MPCGDTQMVNRVTTRYCNRAGQYIRSLVGQKNTLSSFNIYSAKSRFNIALFFIVIIQCINRLNARFCRKNVDRRKHLLSMVFTFTDTVEPHHHVTNSRKRRIFSFLNNINFVNLDTQASCGRLWDSHMLSLLIAFAIHVIKLHIIILDQWYPSRWWY